MIRRSYLINFLRPFILLKQVCPRLGLVSYVVIDSFEVRENDKNEATHTDAVPGWKPMH